MRALRSCPTARYHLGPLRGRFDKPEAEFIGATAREQRRQRLLAELDERIALLTTELDFVRRDLEGLAAETGAARRDHRHCRSRPRVFAAREALVSAVATARTKGTPQTATRLLHAYAACS